MGNQSIRTTGAWCTLSPVLRTGTCARSCVLRVWCLLSGQICYTEFCPGTSLNNTAVGSPIYLQCCSCAFKTSKLPPLPRGTDSRHAGLHTARPRASAGRRRPASGRGGVGPPNTTPSPPRGGPLGTAAWLKAPTCCQNGARAPGKCRLAGRHAGLPEAAPQLLGGRSTFTGWHTGLPVTRSTSLDMRATAELLTSQTYCCRARCRRGSTHRSPTTCARSPSGRSS